MNIIFINITTYRGISSNAEHFYAKVSRPYYNADMVAFDFLTNFNTCSGDPEGEDLKYHPTRKEAETMAQKDYPDTLDDNKTSNPSKMREHAVKTVLETGTIRFPSVMAILRSAREKYPDAVIYYTFHGSHKEFLRRFCFDESESINKETERLILPDIKTQ